MLYVWLCAHMRRRGVDDPPYFAYFFLFVTLGGWLLVVLSELFGFWSAMASLGMFYLLLVSPFIAAAIGFFLYPDRTDSVFHRWAVRLCIVYAVVQGVVSTSFVGRGVLDILSPRQ